MLQSHVFSYITGVTSANRVSSGKAGSLLDEMSNRGGMIM